MIRSCIKSVINGLSSCSGVEVFAAGREACVLTQTPQRRAVVLSAFSEPSRISVQMERDGGLNPSPDDVEQTPAKNQVPRVRKNLRKPRGRRRKVKESDCTLKLLAELPFTGTDVWKELGFSGAAAGMRKRKKGEREEPEEEGKKEEEKKKKKKAASARPNYFVSIPITNQKIKNIVKEVQAAVVQKDPRLSRALIPVGTLHITLLVTHLSTQEQIDTAALAIEEMEPMLTSLVGGQSLVLPFRGIGHFRQEVAFVQIADAEHVRTLGHIADSVRKAFEEKGIPTGDQKDFKPHLTFIKLSRAPRLRRQGVRKLDASVYEGFEGRAFGEESVCSMDLCSMLKKKDADGYYYREKTVTFDVLQNARRTSRISGKRGPELDDDELMSLSKRLVEDAVSRAVQQYMEETQQNGSAPKLQAPPKTNHK